LIESDASGKAETCEYKPSKTAARTGAERAGFSERNDQEGRIANASNVTRFIATDQAVM